MLQTNIKIVTQNPQRYLDIGWTAFEDCQTALAALEFHSYYQIDVETTGLGSFLLETLNTIQVGIPGTQYIFDNTIPFSVLKRPLESKLLILQGSLFDLPYLFKNDIFPTNIWCCLTAEYCLTRGIQYPRGYRGLEALTERYCNVKIDKSRQSEIAAGITTISDIIYSGTDVVYLEAIMEGQTALAARRGMTDHIKIKNNFNLYLAYLEFCGFPIDTEALYDYIREAEAEEWLMLKKLKTYRDINWRSSQQVAEILKELGIEEINEETGNALTGVDVLQKHDEVPLVADLLQFRALAKKVTSYGRKWFHYIIDGKIHTRYRQHTDTGRTSCGATDRKKYEPWDVSYTCEARFPNMQQLPPEFRPLFKAPKGWKLVVADYSGQESVILADQSEEPNLLRFYQKEKGDLHCFVARLVYPELKDLTDEDIKENHSDKRQLVKSASFAIAYGGNGNTIASNLNIPVEQGDEVYEKYMNAFGGLKEFFKHCYTYSASSGYVPLDKFGGKRFFNKGREFKEKYNDKSYWDKYYDAKRANTAWYQKEKELMMWFHMMARDLRKDAVNSRIQGTGATMSALAANYMYKYIHANKLFDKVKAAAFVHDELAWWVKDKLAPKFAEVLEAAMKKAGEQCLTHLKIEAKAKIMDVWEK